MLFSEPKIPQFADTRRDEAAVARFSALQRAENSSIGSVTRPRSSPSCFSALQRAENSSSGQRVMFTPHPSRFSALQRAENSSSPHIVLQPVARNEFQCSSASRKFLIVNDRNLKSRKVCFSALQRAENSSSIGAAAQRPVRAFQCSSASRKFLIRPSHLRPSIFPTATITLRRS